MQQGKHHLEKPLLLLDCTFHFVISLTGAITCIVQIATVPSTTGPVPG